MRALSVLLTTLAATGLSGCEYQEAPEQAPTNAVEAEAAAGPANAATPAAAPTAAVPSIEAPLAKAVEAANAELESAGV